jgi:hypothetical protein
MPAIPSKSTGATRTLRRSADDIEAVVRYLDDHHYHYPKPEK